MSECVRALDTLLEADLDELEGRADSDLGRHIADCAGCADAARAILDGNRALDRVLDAAPSIDASAIVARAKLGTVRGNRHAERTRGRAWHRWAGLATAAALAAALLTQRESPLPGVALPPRPETRATIETPANRSYAVFETDNPDITVLWFF